MRRGNNNMILVVLTIIVLGVLIAVIKFLFFYILIPIGTIAGFVVIIRELIKK